MGHWVAERYTGPAEAFRLRGDAERMRRAARAVARTRFVQTVYLPGDDLCFYVFESESAEDVAAVALAAAVDVDRIHAAELSA